MSTSTELDKDEKGKSVDIKTYRGMIESLLYLTASRPDIMFSVCLCARFQLVLRNLIYVQLREYLNICLELLI